MSSRNVTLADLAAAAGAQLAKGSPDTPIHSVHYDSRAVGPGGLFVALRGGYVDGHAYLEDALRRGAVAAMVESQAESMAASFPAVLVVPDTRKALSPLSARFFEHPGDKLGVIGVTGTDGKTTTSYLIDAMLRANGYATGLVGTVSVRIGDQVTEHDTRQTTPESLEVQRLLWEMNRESVDWAVIEATSHALALPRLDDCPFDIGVVTNVTREHLDFHGSVEAYRESKGRLLERVQRAAMRGRPGPRGAVINADDEGARSIAHRAGDVPVIWYGLNSTGTDISASDISPHAAGTRFQLSVGDRAVEVNLKLIGSYNVLNSMAAAGVGHLLGFDLDAMRDGLESLPHVPGRLQRVDMGQPFTVIVDYAHSPASLEETLALIRRVAEGRVITVFGSAGERDRGKRAVQGAVAARLADFAVFTSEDPRFEDPNQIIREIADGARSAGASEGTGFVCIEDRRLAIATAIDAARPGDVVLLAGKGHEKCMIYDDQRVPWNEELETRRALQQLGYDTETAGTE